MTPNDKEFVTRQSRGVKTNENDFPASSDITVTEMENEFNYRQLGDAAAHDADQSSVSMQLDNPNSVQSSSDFEANYYRMKTSSRKGLKERPSVVTFQQYNPRVGRYYYKRRLPPNVSRSRWELAPERTLPGNLQQIPSNQQTNVVNHVESYQSSEQFQQPRRFRSKMRQIFSRFRQPEKLNRQSNTDVEAQNVTEHAEFYHFDHGEPTYYRTTDCPPHLTSDIVAQRVHDTFTKFWAEFFGYINVLVTLVITFVIQFYRFILYGILRALFIGIFQTTSDYLLKPVLAFLFNGLLQPIFTLLRNIFQSICDMSEPLANTTSNMLQPFTECVRAFRIVEIKNQTKLQPPETRLLTFQGQSND